VVNSFTPNGDNYNDTWIIENLYLYPNAEVRVFNRWGSLLFESIGTYSPWDGVYKGQALPSEVYYYIIRLNNGIDNQSTGTVTIVR
jgi:gliding motility-associated-like protein